MGPGFLHTIGITAHMSNYSATGSTATARSRAGAQPRLRPILRQLAAFVLAAAADD
jgi:hypothetical protein